MKKFVFILLVTFVALSTHAENAVGSWCVSPKLGLNLSTLSNSSDTKLRATIIGGADIEYMATNIFSLSFGALYSQQGCKAHANGLDGTIKLDYINVPIMANFYILGDVAFKIGIQPGFLVNDKVKASANGASAEVGLEDAFRAAGLSSNTNSVVLDIPFGLSYQYSNLVFDLRYNLGVTKAFSAAGEGFKNRAFQITVSYKFKL